MVAPSVAVAQLRQMLTARPADTDDAGPVLRQLRRDVIAIEAAELTRLYEDGVISADTRRQLQRRLDLEETSLDD